MVKKARVLVTKYCGRNCDGCCNKDDMFVPTVINSIDEVRSYDEILLTGGDPFRFPKELTQLVKEIRSRKNMYFGKIYVYASSFENYSGGSVYINNDNYVIWDKLDEYCDFWSNISGIHYTLHDGATDKDIVALKNLTNFISNRPKISKRLAIDKRLYEQYDFGNINLSTWDVVRKLVWKEHCPLPPGEELFILKDCWKKT